MKEYYRQRFYWIFHYTSKNFFYVLAKTLCIAVGLPLYCVAIAAEMVLTVVNLLLGWIPALGTLITVVCKALIFVVNLPYYICVLPDIRQYLQAVKAAQEDEVSDEEQPQQDVAENLPQDGGEVQQQNPENK